MTRQLDTKASAELLDGGLAHRIWNGARPIDVGEYRTHHDDLSAAADHRIHRGRHRVDDSGHVDGQDTIDLAGCECAECAATAENTGVGDHDINTPKPLEGQANGFLDLFEDGDIAL